FVSELGIQYRSSSLSLEDGLNGGAHAGDRAADALVEIAAGPGGKTGEAHIFDLIDPARFTLLFLDPDNSADARSDQAASALAQALPTELNVWHALDASGFGLSEQYGTARPSFYLIRPDGYVMARGTPDHAGKVAEA